MARYRKTGTYFWEYRLKRALQYSRNFKNVSTAKKWMKLQIKKDKHILGRNKLFFTKNILTDIEIGYYGISGQWWQVLAGHI